MVQKLLGWAREMLEVKLKYPDCPECQLLDGTGVDRTLINAYHEDEIDITRLPKMAQKVLKGYRKRMGYLNGSVEE